MSHFNRLSISIAGTAAVALVSLPLGITPANASRVSQATTSNIEIMEPLSNAQKFNLKPQGASTGLVAKGGKKGGNGGVNWLQELLQNLGLDSADGYFPTQLSS